MLNESDPIFIAVREALDDGFAGVIFSGPPGTGKTECASRIAQALALSDANRVRYIQFHPSFQYEDFVEGFVPNETGGFKRALKHLCIICNQASLDPLNTYVLVIDEISRCDAARVFGEALTYIESSKRNLKFYLASGTEMVIPSNIVFLATMNPWDRGVDEVDIAFERRFAHIDMVPDVRKLREMLSSGSFSQTETDAIARFFEAIQKMPNRFLHVGHAYFVRAVDRASTLRLWNMQLRHHFERASRSNPGEFERVLGLWEQLVVRAFTTTTEENTTDEQHPENATA